MEGFALMSIWNTGTAGGDLTVPQCQPLQICFVMYTWSQKQEDSQLSEREKNSLDRGPELYGDSPRNLDIVTHFRDEETVSGSWKGLS